VNRIAERHRGQATARGEASSARASSAFGGTGIGAANLRAGCGAHLPALLTRLNQYAPADADNRFA